MNHLLKNGLPRKAFLGVCVFFLSFFMAFPYQKPLSKTSAQKKVLDNGLTLIYQLDTSSPLTVLQIFIKGGKGAEPQGKEGLAYLTTRLTLEIPDRGKIQDLMNQATHLSMSCERDYSLVRISCLSEYLESTLDLVTTIMGDPLFSGLRINRIKELMGHYRESESDDPLNVAHNAFTNSLFQNTPYAGLFYGSKQSLKAIKKKDIVNFYKNHFNADNMIISLSTDRPKKEIVKTIQEYFNEFPPGESSETKSFSFTPPENHSQTIDKDTQQYVVSLGYPLPKTTTKNYVYGLMLENLLGKGFNSRLWPLRVKEKLAYHVNSRVTLLRKKSMIEAFLETDRDKKEYAVQALKRTLHRLSEKGITQKELKTTKIFTKASFLRENETKKNRTYTLGSFEALGLGFDFLQRIFQEIDKIEVEEFNSFLQNYLDPHKEIQVIVGPQRKKSPPQNK
ncbi:insulinase family protein [bacterium]|nr:insulinase family protein [bacterium]